MRFKNQLLTIGDLEHSSVKESNGNALEEGKKRAGAGPDFYYFDRPKKLKFLTNLKKSGFNIGLACRAVDVTRQTYFNHMKLDPIFNQAVVSIREDTLDQHEATAFKNGKNAKRGFLDRAMMLKAYRGEVFDKARRLIVEGHSVTSGQAKARLARAEMAVDAEIVKSGLDRQSQKALRQGRLQVESGEGGAGGSGVEGAGKP